MHRSQIFNLFGSGNYPIVSAPNFGCILSNDLISDSVPNLDCINVVFEGIQVCSISIDDTIGQNNKQRSNVKLNTSQDAFFLLETLIVATILIYRVSETINLLLLCFLRF